MKEMFCPNVKNIGGRAYRTFCMVLLMSVSSATFADPIHDAYKDGDILLVKAYLEGTHAFTGETYDVVDVNAQDDDGRTLLHYVLARGFEGFLSAQAWPVYRIVTLYTDQAKKTQRDLQWVEDGKHIRATIEYESDKRDYEATVAAYERELALYNTLLANYNTALAAHQASIDAATTDDEKDAIRANAPTAPVAPTALTDSAPVEPEKVIVELDTSSVPEIAYETFWYDLLVYLIDKGANVNSQDRTGKAPLHALADSHHLQPGFNFEDEGIVSRTLTLILEKGGNVDVADNTGKTALWWAIRMRNLTAVKLMVEDYDANLKYIDADGNTYLHQAVDTNAVDVFRYLVPNEDIVINQLNDDGETGLSMILCKRYLDDVYTFLDLGASPNLGTSCSGRHNMHIAVSNFDGQWFQEEAVKAKAQGLLGKMLEKGGDPDAYSSGDRYSILGWAMVQHKPYHVETLLEAGADPYYESPAWDIPPLAVAALINLDSLKHIMATIIEDEGADVATADMAVNETFTHWNYSARTILDYMKLFRSSNTAALDYLVSIGAKTKDELDALANSGS